MPKLKTIKSKLATLAPRLGRPPGDEKARDRERRETQEYRAWYKTKRWQQLRWEILKRDRFTCQQTGVLCTAKAPAPNSPVVDHIRQHRGDPDLFWDPKNLQCVSKAYHDSEKQKQERAQAW